MSYALKEPTGNYFVNPSYYSWDFTNEEGNATTFDTEEEANEVKELIERAIVVTYWDYDDVIPFPTVVELKGGVQNG